MRILHVGNASLVEALRALGHEVLVAFDEYPELAAPGRSFDARTLWQRLPARPDVLLVVDTLGRQTLPYGVEDVPALRVYHAIDVHLNFFWQRHYANLFDVVVAAQKDYVPLLASAGVAAHWLPAAIEPRVFRDLGLPRIFDVAFVGTVDGNRMKRTAAVELLRSRFGMMVFGASPAERLSAPEMARVFAASRIVFNESVLGDVNFRLFEAMACGAFVLTEDVDNGLRDLFMPGEHLDVYGVDDLVPKVAHYLAAEDERARIAAAGAAAVRRRHTLAARAAELSDILERAERRPGAGARAAFHWGSTLELTIVRGLVDPNPAMRAASESLNAAAVEGGDPEAALALAEIMLWAGRDTGALALLAAARRRAPGLLRAWLLAGHVELRRGDRRAAAALLRGGVEVAPDVSSAARTRALAAIDAGPDTSACWCALGVVMQEAGLPFIAGLVRQFDVDPPRSAVDYFTRAIEIDPANREAAERAAALLEFMRLPEFAVRYYEPVVGLVPQDRAARERLCRLLAASFQLDAVAHHRRVLAALRGETPDGNREERARACHEAGVALRASGDTARAVAVLDQAAACAPGRLETLTDAALARVDAGDYPGAAAFLERALASASSGRDELTTLLALVRAAAAEARQAI